MYTAYVADLWIFLEEVGVWQRKGTNSIVDTAASS